MGSGHEKTGCSTQSDLSPGAWFVLDPSKPQIGSSAPSATILVLDRSLAVGSVPSIQMYSALKGMGVLASGLVAAGPQWLQVRARTFSAASFPPVASM
jgi:hypothetical protein